MEATLAAILLLQPALPADTASQYAYYIHTEATRHEIDPILVVALIHYESRWNRAADSRRGDYGLMQIRARAHRLNRRTLLNPEENIRIGVAILASWKQYHKEKCRKDEHFWWAHYQHGNTVKGGVSGRRIKRLRDWLHARAGGAEMAFRLIGLCGASGVGKDTVANYLASNMDMAKVAIADPIKRFCVNVLGASPKALWGESSSRDDVLDIRPQDWKGIIRRMQIHDKRLVRAATRHSVKSAEALLTLWGWLYNVYKTKQPTFRWLLRTLGTEWGRSLDPDIWINYLYSMCYHKLKEGYEYSPSRGVGKWRTTPYRGIIIPDHRFQNEIKFTRKFGGFMIRITRNSVSSDRSHATEMTDDLPSRLFDMELRLEEGEGNVKKQLDDLILDSPWVEKSKV